jgi:hypothetical protein
MPLTLCLENPMEFLAYRNRFGPHGRCILRGVLEKGKHRAVGALAMSLSPTINPLTLKTLAELFTLQEHLRELHPIALLSVEG